MIFALATSGRREPTFKSQIKNKRRGNCLSRNCHDGILFTEYFLSRRILSDKNLQAAFALSSWLFCSFFFVATDGMESR
jgi:hypothetical protein